ncbi:YaaL family protein [Desertibacillus haloalkaliphilus]|uniref:YaaL family protein n=1 Tax=Desertibacillus haloalkaliphilus TaxID=1328930 RepID=UPI001C274B42|nr:YaaL family protein [Desertibacillus haloalkaliphilus]MBU8908400.1 YaaL family protein [Desertibacillus haloalkaliphilus]
MFFQRKKRIRQAEDERLLALIEEMKQRLSKQQAIISSSVDPSPTVLNDLRITEAKYLFLLKEARVRHENGNDKSN